MSSVTAQGGSPSLHQPDMWWYRARADLLRTVFDRYLPEGSDATVLDIGSADGPSAYWTGRPGHVVPVDPDIRGLGAGSVCAALPDLPFPDGTFDVVSAFDVVEHCADEAAALREVRRVLRPGGVFLMSVPAYTWAWSDFDVHNGHHRRYTRRRAVAAVEGAGLQVLRATHAFAGVFPAFAAQRLSARVAERFRGDRPQQAADVAPVPSVPPLLERTFLGLSQLDRKVLGRWDLPVGSSVFVAATAVGAASSASSPSR
ncbi:class I SAM-dependent methyltransferase [Nocardioides solisilvae]|uniref:class I SAM-dependent methyltransferase n=1 Tax=Nocardioides solisilvae TaxID=1542435 RepID=UPI000D74102C|nr:class I SAM-dependent methyltransferase [Nocardioides solisilvae]